MVLVSGIHNSSSFVFLLALCSHAESSVSSPAKSGTETPPSSPGPPADISNTAGRNGTVQCTYMQCKSCCIPYLCYCTTAVLRMYVMTVMEIVHRHPQCKVIRFCFLSGALNISPMLQCIVYVRTVVDSIHFKEFIHPNFLSH